MNKKLVGVAGLWAACAGQPKPAPATAAAPAAAVAPAPVAQKEEAPAAAPAAAAAHDEPIDVQLSVEAMTRNSPPRWILPDETLHSGDRMAMSVHVDRPAYVYVALAAADGGKPTLLYPPAGAADALINPGAGTRIPATGQWFRLDQDTGQEDLFVYAARAPIAADELQARMDKDAHAVKPATAEAPKKKPRPHRPRVAAADPANAAPGGLGDGTRGLALESEEPAQVDAGGVTAVHFAIHHKK